MKELIAEGKVSSFGLSEAGALIGLQSVIMTLTAERPPVQAAAASAAFVRPTVVNFSAVLLLAPLIDAPSCSFTG